MAERLRPFGTSLGGGTQGEKERDKWGGVDFNSFSYCLCNVHFIACFFGSPLPPLHFLTQRPIEDCFTVDVLSEDETQGLRKTSESRVEQLLQKSSSRRSSSASVEENEEPEKAVVDSQEQEKLGKLITNVNLMTSQLELHYFEDTDNEIVIRAREMSEMVSEMYLFTRGEGALQTTEELFEASQNFADAGKALYRVARKYASKAEESPIKKELLRYVDKIPAYCHQLLFTSRSLAIGQAACCRKNSPLKLPPDQRLWQIDESIFSEESSLATLSRCSSLQSIENNESEQRTTAEHSNGVVYKTEL
ncbi:Catenin alpha [Stylophora pistillata]|uniref:Catenin alpha n=1 Tax=Stylophora pistillata TaxID=50429 RepID=A0A2B4RWX1_STYPI|nr:Catenin alpha [Stylophora pistillata]